MAILIPCFGAGGGGVAGEGAFGQHFDIYRDQDKLGMVPYSEEDKRSIIDHQWEDVHPLTRHIPIERFLSVLAPAAS